MKSYRQLMTTKRGRISLLRNKPLNGYFYLLIELDIQSQAVIPKHIKLIKDEVVMKLRGIEEVMREVEWREYRVERM